MIQDGSIEGRKKSTPVQQDVAHTLEIHNTLEREDTLKIKGIPRHPPPPKAKVLKYSPCKIKMDIFQLFYYQQVL